MNLAKISPNGQVTVPVEVRRLLGLKAGDKILFFQNEEGAVVINNASAYSIKKAQDAFSGAAEILGVKNDDDVQAMIDELRKGKNE